MKQNELGMFFVKSIKETQITEQDFLKYAREDFLAKMQQNKSMYSYTIKGKSEQ